MTSSDSTPQLANDATRPFTLAMDIGGSKMKASVLDAAGAMVVEQVRIPTPYPLPPARFVEVVRELAEKLPTADRDSVGFPGMVRGGVVLKAQRFSTTEGPGSALDPLLVAQWEGYDLAARLAESLALPTRVANDADMQGAAVIEGRGLELVLTLGTGFGTGLFYLGELLPHLEIAHHPFAKGQTYDDRVGDEARQRIGEYRWNQRVMKAVSNLRTLMHFDHCYIGGGNSRFLHEHQLPSDVSLVDNLSGILGGIRLWEPKKASTPDSSSN